MSKEELDGVWRTVRGRRIFIKKGESLDSAIERSGKFNDNDKENLKKLEKVIEEDKKIGNIANRLKAIENQQRYDRLYDKYKEQGMSDEKINNLLGERPKTGLESNNKVDNEYELYKRAKERPETIDAMTENSTDWEALDEKYGKTYSLEKELEKKKETVKNYVEKKQSNRIKKEDDWLPKEVEIKEQGTSNRKEVSDNIQAHILSYYDSPQDFIHQMDVMKQPTNWHNGQKIAEGGSYLIYNGDMADFLDKLKINPKGKKFSEDKAFNTYVSLIGRESARLYDKIKKHQKGK